MSPKYKVLYDEEYTDEETLKIELQDGKWTGVVYHYNVISIKEDKDQTELSFTYDIDSVPSHIDTDKLSPKDKQDFETLLGDIVIDIVLNTKRSK